MAALAAAFDALKSSRLVPGAISGISFALWRLPNQLVGATL
jgi:hypothetical protein